MKVRIQAIIRIHNFMCWLKLHYHPPPPCFNPHQIFKQQSQKVLSVITECLLTNVFPRLQSSNKEHTCLLKEAPTWVH